MKNIHEIEIKIEGNDWSEAIDSSFTKAQKTVKVDGFRKGKVPRNIFEKKFGKESLYMDAVDIVLPKAYTDALNANKLVPIIQPKIDIKEINENGVTILFTITTKPEVKIKKYTNLGVKKDTVKVTKKEIEDEVGKLVSDYADMVEKDGKIENGDTAVIDFEGFKDGVAFDGGKGENYPLEIGSNTFIPGFEEQLIGLKSGEEKDVNVTFPEDYHSEDLKGAPVTFKVKVHEVKTKQLPKMDKEFFKDLGYDDIETEEQLKDLIKVDLEAKKEYEIENKYVDDLLEAASKNTEVEIPEELVDEEIHRMMHQYEDNLKAQGITLDMFYQFTNSTEEQLKEQMKGEAEKRVKYRFMLEEIISLEKIEVTDKEADKEAIELAKKYQMEKDDFIKEIGGLDSIKYELEMQKVIDILKK
jgi:trigger factor